MEEMMKTAEDQFILGELCKELTEEDIQQLKALIERRNRDKIEKENKTKVQTAEDIIVELISGLNISIAYMDKFWERIKKRMTPRQLDGKAADRDYFEF